MYDDLGQHGIGVLTETGYRTHGLLETGDHRRRQQRRDLAVGGVDRTPAVAGLQLRVRDDLAGQGPEQASLTEVHRPRFG